MSTNDAVRRAWEANAAHWDDYMGAAGNDFVNRLVWPATQRLLDARPGERVIDVASGNGLYALRLAELGAHVTAFDFSAALIARARTRSAAHAGRIDLPRTRRDRSEQPCWRWAKRGTTRRCATWPSSTWPTSRRWPPGWRGWCGRVGASSSRSCTRVSTGCTRRLWPRGTTTAAA